MLLISPACCGRNTRALSGPGRYGERFAYLELTTTDIVTGAHLKKIPEAARLFLESRTDRPSCLLLCTTCVDALLGTDMNRIARKTQSLIHLPTRPCYMYALTRESLHPPMVQVRETIASLLEKPAPAPVPPPCHEPPSATTNASVNLLGYFSPLSPTSDLFPLLRTLGYDATRQLSTCRTYADFQTMASSTLNLVLTPESLPAAEAMATRLHIPYITLRRFYTPSRIHKQYQALARALGRDLDDTAWYEKAKAAIHTLKTILLPPRGNAAHFRRHDDTDAAPLRGHEHTFAESAGFPKDSVKESSVESVGTLLTPPSPDSPFATASPRIALGSRLNADPLDLALLLTSCGFTITDIITTLDPSDTYFLTLLKTVSPNTRLHGALDPSMAAFRPAILPDLTLGADAATYYPGVPNIPWNEEIQPFGYQAPITLLKAIQTALHLS